VVKENSSAESDPSTLGDELLEKYVFYFGLLNQGEKLVFK
jgi:hypothetical protein